MNQERVDDVARVVFWEVKPPTVVARRTAAAKPGRAMMAIFISDTSSLRGRRLFLSHVARTSASAQTAPRPATASATCGSRLALRGLRRDAEMPRCARGCALCDRGHTLQAAALLGPKKLLHRLDVLASLAHEACQGIQGRAGRPACST
eukprot:scaffold23186_cov112-Isochrysis_galbana.AAC.6